MELTKIGIEITNSAVKKIEALDDRFFRIIKNRDNFTKELRALIDEQSEGAF